MTANQAKEYDVVVIGAGITGLTTAYRLSKETGLRVALLEKEAQVGGVIQSVEKDGYHLEYAANTFLPSATAVLDLCQEIQLEPVKASPQAKKRYIFFQGRLVPVPMDPLSLLTTPLLSLSGKLKLFSEPFCPKGNPEEESVAQFTRRRLGQNVLDNLMGPFLSGVYAGDPDSLSLKAVFPKLAYWEEEHGGLIKGALNQLLSKKKNTDKAKKKDRRMLSFKQGMAEFPQTLARKLPQGMLHLQTAVERFSKTSAGYELQLSSGETWKAKTVVFSTPAHVASKLLLESEPLLSKTLGNIPYVPMGIVHLAFDESLLLESLDGFGFLVPRKAGIQTLGSIWSSCLYPERAPEGKVLLTCFIGGALQTEVASWTDEALIQQVLSDLSCLMGFKLKMNPELTHVKLWKQAIPQYVFGTSESHLDRHRILESHSPDNLILAGNYRTGVSVNDCVLQGEKSACAIVQVLKKKESLLSV